MTIYTSDETRPRRLQQRMRPSPRPPSWRGHRNDASKTALKAWGNATTLILVEVAIATVLEAFVPDHRRSLDDHRFPTARRHPYRQHENLRSCGHPAGAESRNYPRRSLIAPSTL